MSEPILNDDGYSVKGCTYIYPSKGQAGEYAPLTVNPYRGCGHECAYCLAGDTLVQLTDGSAKPIKDIAIGDFILGISVNGKSGSWTTRITTTQVLAKVKSVKKAYKITLDDGTQVICSADHRWLTERGWKYTDADGKKRPSLTTNNCIRKVGNAIETPAETKNYQIGYIAGMIEGDANLAIYDYSDRKRKSGKTMGIQHRFRLALKDQDALARTKYYLSENGIQTTDFPFPSKGEPMFAIGTTSPERVARIKAMTVPRSDSEWMRGWLAGIFDAEGSHGKEALRISNSDESILKTTENALQAFGFQSVRDISKTRNVCYIRILGGREETMRFWQLVNPAIKRKFTLEGQAVNKSVRVTSIECREYSTEMFDIMTGTETFIANGMVSHNCYVPLVLKMKREEFDAGATPRPNFMQHLRADAEKYRALGLTDQQIFTTFTSDVFNPYDMSLTRPVLETLIEYGFGFCTLTKGGARALPFMDMFRSGRDAFAATLTSLDDAFSLKWERNASLPSERIDVLKKFHAAGIFTWVSLEPTLNVESSLEIVRHTHEFVDLYKVGRANYLPMTQSTNWEDYCHRMIDLLQKLGAKHYIKKDLQKYLPPGYYNPMRIPQHH